MSFKKNVARGLATAATVTLMSAGGFVAAAPAMAADGDRESTPMVNTSGNVEGSLNVAQDVAAGFVVMTHPELETMLADTPERVTVISYPALGTSGPIILENTGIGSASNLGKCAVAVEVDSTTMPWATCDGSALQTWDNVATDYDSEFGKGVQLVNTAISNPGVRLAVTTVGVKPLSIESRTYGFIKLTVPVVEETLTLTSPAAGSVIGTENVVFEGFAEPGSTVVITDADGNELATGTAGPDGSFAITVEEIPTEGAQEITITAGADTVTFNFVVVAGGEEGTPLMDPMFAGFGVLTALAAGAAGMVVRRRSLVGAA